MEIIVERSALCTRTHSTRGKKCDGVLTCTSAQPVECRCCCLLLQSFGLPRVDVWLQSSYSLYPTIRREAVKLEREGGREGVVERMGRGFVEEG